MGAALRTNGSAASRGAAARGRRRGRSLRRLGAKTDSEALALVLKTSHRAWQENMSLVRVLAGRIGNSAALNAPMGGKVSSMSQHDEDARTGRRKAWTRPPPATPSHSGGSNRRAPEIRYGPEGPHPAVVARFSAPSPVLALSIAAKERKDDVKLGQALDRLIDGRPHSSCGTIPRPTKLSCGTERMPLRVAPSGSSNRFGVAITQRTKRRYRETIQKPIVQRGRHQSGPAATANSVMSSRCQPAAAWLRLHLQGRGPRAA